MSVSQLDIFEYDNDIQCNDDVYRRLARLQVNQQVNIRGLQIERNDKFFIVSKNADFEEPFRTLESCYKFVNQNL